MLNVFSLDNVGIARGRLIQVEVDSPQVLIQSNPVWVDLESPTSEEKNWITSQFGMAIPENAVDEDLEESARFYEVDNGEIHLRSDFLIDDADGPRNLRVAFIVKNGVLFSIRDEDVPVFRLLRLRARRTPAFIEDAKDVLLKLFDADVEYSADS